ncbi:VOC family protein [Tomitella cavernea]|uniref:VOC family protein n=1 Tax=Tomitella cavernea TaxID=1387982 RepID=A0ABP9D5C3_9ACTN|nr:VOC family protein [Tomitella cavernea]
MSIKRLNHAVLYVSELQRSLDFYVGTLGFRVLSQFPGAAFLQAADSANDHDLGLFQLGDTGPRPARGVGLYHLAWEVDTLDALAEMGRRLSEAGSLTGAGDHGSTKALYGADPDGIEFEVCWMVPDASILDELKPGSPPTRPLDLDAEIAKYGADTPGGPREDFDVWEQIRAR